MIKKTLTIALISLIFNSITYAGDKNLIEPRTNVDNGIALTIDMCSGKADKRIIELLIEKKVKATFFITNKWIEKNSDTVNLIDTHSELFKVENHGENHLAAITTGQSPYKIKKVGDLDTLKEEVLSGKEFVDQNFKHIKSSNYYRTAGAQYDEACYKWLAENNYKIAGYTVAADGGAKYTWKITLQNLNKAKPGDVVLIHGNHSESGNYQALEHYLSTKSSKEFVWLS